MEKIKKFFKLEEKGTDVKTEFVAGLTTFCAMVYILMVNAEMFADLEGVSYGAIYIATAISAVVGTVLIGLLANLPLAQASGMGLNAFFVYTICFEFGFSYANALVMVLIDGVVFIVLTATGLRKKIFDAIPDVVRKAIPAGIGLFIAFIGLQGTGIVVNDNSTFVTLASVNVLKVSWGSIMPIILTLLVLFAIAVMAHKKLKGAVLWGILGGTLLYYLLGLTVSGFYDAGGAGSITWSSPFDAFGDFGTQAFGKIFTDGFNFGAYIDKNGAGNFILILVTSAFAFCMVDMFDTMGTLYGACARGKMLTADDEVPNMNKAMLADAIATTTGAICGTSTVTTYVESSAGIAAGGRTGLSSMFTALFFFIAMFLSPIAQIIPGVVTNAALIYVGVLMMAGVKDIDWTSIDVAVPAFLTIAMMPFTYNISYGIAFGMTSYAIIKLCTGKAKEINLGTYIIALLFIAMLLFTH